MVHGQGGLLGDNCGKTFEIAVKKLESLWNSSSKRSIKFVFTRRIVV